MPCAFVHGLPADVEHQVAGAAGRPARPGCPPPPRPAGAPLRRRAVRATCRGHRRRACRPRRGRPGGPGRRAAGPRRSAAWSALTGTARPSPTPATAVLMPTTRPVESASAPPELPGLSAASVWITSSITRPACPLRVGRERPSALTTPAVTEPASPSGLPTATTSWPTTRRSASPRRTGAGRSAGRSARSTARSESGSAPTTRDPRLHAVEEVGAAAGRRRPPRGRSSPAPRPRRRRRRSRCLGRSGPRPPAG